MSPNFNFHFAEDFDLPGVKFYNLQKDATADVPGVTDFMNEVADFADTAAIVANLDVVVSVDTSVVHLAGAMGKPVLMLDRYDNCWRWLTGRTDSPWYTTARLFRQRSPGDWDSVVAEVATELASVLNQNFPRLVRL